MKNFIANIVFILILLTAGAVSVSGFWFENLASTKDDFHLPAEFWSQGRDIFSLKPNNNPAAGGFSSKQFDAWLLHVTFDADNIPTYTFLTPQGSSWAKGNSSNAYMYSGSTIKVGSVPISSMRYYLYKGSEKGNPLFSQSNVYNQSPHLDSLKRFYFYRFVGKAMGMVGVDNPLGAVDTYSKLLFVYSTPENIVQIFGRPMPKRWISVEEYSNSKGNAYMFYEYDPIGWVSADGSVTLFEWFKERQRKGIFFPRKSSLSTNIAAAGEEGRSPYASGEKK